MTQRPVSNCVVKAGAAGRASHNSGEREPSVMSAFTAPANSVSEPSK